MLKTVIIVIYCMDNINNNNSKTENSKCNRNESKATNSLYDCRLTSIETEAVRDEPVAYM